MQSKQASGFNCGFNCVYLLLRPDNDDIIDIDNDDNDD